MTVDWDAATVLTLTEFEVAWEAAGLDETPWELDPPRHGRTWEERREIVDGALASLAARGLVDDRRPVPRLAAALAVLDRRELSVDVRVHGTTVVGAVAARHRGRDRAGRPRTDAAVAGGRGGSRAGVGGPRADGERAGGRRRGGGRRGG